VRMLYPSVAFNRSTEAVVRNDANGEKDR